MKQAITGSTTVCGVIGDPIEHTLSPAMHNAAFRELGLDFVYLPFHVHPRGLEAAIGGMRGLNIRGLNVTIPHKLSVIPLLDDVDPAASRIGAVNTIVNYKGKLTGYNTDAPGFIHALHQEVADLKGRQVLVIGAGGAARAVAFALAGEGAELTILNRQEEFDWAEELAATIHNAFGLKVTAALLEHLNLAPALAQASVLVNATSLGMAPNDDLSPVPADLLRPGLIVFDVVYNPLETRLLREAKAAGGRAISGLEMLVWQGALAFQMFTGYPAPVELMRREAIRQLEGHED